MSARAKFRTPVGYARGLGSAKTGTGHFWWLRVTSIVLTLLVPWLIGTLVSLAGADLAAVQAALAKPWNAIFMALFVACMFLHSQLGLQVVIEDYVHHRPMQIFLMLLNTFANALAGLASLYAIARIAILA